jgi:hypothetical protein
MSNFWINEQGVNTLRGEYDNPSNPLRLPDDIVLEFLKTYPEARNGLHALYPNMTQGERERLESFAAFFKPNTPQPDPEQIVEDKFQTKANDLRVNARGVVVKEFSTHRQNKLRVNFPGR